MGRRIYQDNSHIENEFVPLMECWIRHYVRYFRFTNELLITSLSVYVSTYQDPDISIGKGFHCEICLRVFRKFLRKESVSLVLR